ncbi:unnamed protein product [Lathyrus oleraceus]
MVCSMTCGNGSMLTVHVATGSSKTGSSFGCNMVLYAMLHIVINCPSVIGLVHSLAASMFDLLVDVWNAI